MGLLEYLKLCEKSRHSYFHTSIHPPYSSDNFGIRNTRPLTNLQDKVQITDELNALLKKYLEDNLEEETFNKRCDDLRNEINHEFGG
jgi:hypothetical protein